jgi:hypothetical protein
LCSETRPNAKPENVIVHGESAHVVLVVDSSGGGYGTIYEDQIFFETTTSKLRDIFKKQKFHIDKIYDFQFKFQTITALGQTIPPAADRLSLMETEERHGL